MVLEFLETGKVLYLMLVVSILGALSKFLVNGRYRKLIKQSQNMGTARDKYLKQWKLKFENTYRSGSGVGNIPVYVEKNLGQYRFMGIRLSRLSRLNSLAAATVCLGGLTAAFMTYWYSDTMEIVTLYAASGILLGGGMVLWEGICNTQGKKGRLLLQMRDYFENTLAGRLELGQAANMPLPEGGYSGDGGIFESERLEDEAENDSLFSKEDIANAFSEIDALIGNGRSGTRKEVAAAAEQQEELRIREEAAGREQDAVFLRERLERIAAGRRGDDGGRKLTEEEEHLIEDIIQEYLYES
ncbi:MAG: hypothetical protein HFI63_06095 [Lachnospiraceae bacterium]|nr:hypothetical protein [Lachnospiraceae bacterium]